MEIFLLFAAEVIAGITFTTAGAYFVKKITKSSKSVYFFNALCSLIAALCVLIFGNINITPSSFIIRMGVFFGIATMLMTIFRTFAAKEGPLGYTSLIVTLSCVITAVSGCIFWGEELTVLKIIGIILMVICFIFSINLSDGKNKKKTVKWFVFSITAMLFTTVVGFIQKIQQESVYKDDFGTFLLIAFICEAVISFVCYFAKSNDKDAQVVYNKQFFIKYIICVLISGMGIGIANITALILTGMVDTSLVFPIANGVPLMGNIILGMILFNEKIQNRQIIGIIAGILAVACLCL